MAETRIAVILGSTRPGRNGKAVADWVLEQSAGRSAHYELIDLADYPLPHFDEFKPPMMQDYANPHTLNWAKTIQQFDGFVFVTPEYNHSTSGVLKNALDYLNVEWNNKAAAFVGYGGVGGSRAVEHLRGIASSLQLAHVSQQLAFSLFTDFRGMTDFAPGPQHVPAAQTMFSQLEAWASVLKPLRATDS